MPLSVTLNDIVNARQALQRLASTAGIGAGMTLTLARVTRVCDVELQTYSKALQDLQDRSARRDERGQPIVRNGMYEMQDQIAFDREHRAMLEQPVELPIGRMKLSTLEREKALPTPLEAAALWWLIVDLTSEKSDVPLLFDEDGD